MQASRLSLLKDIATGFLLIGFLFFGMFIIMPGINTSQITELERQYTKEQRLIVRQTVENTAYRIGRLRIALLNTGLEANKVDDLVLTQLRSDRFGVNGYGYFFVLDEARTMRMHAVQRDLEGKRLDDIPTPDGKSLGVSFAPAFAEKNGAFVEYVWTIPFLGKIEKKTSYVMKVAGTPWLLGSGFYHTDLEEPLSSYDRLSQEIIAATQRKVVVIIAVCFLVLVALSAFAFARIRGTETALAKQMIALEEYKCILDESSLVSRTDVDGNITYVNDAFSKTTGHSREQTLGKSHNIERHPDTPLEAFREMWGTITAGKVWHGVIKNKKADGSAYFKKATIMPLKDETGKISGYISSGQDITELIEKRRDLETVFKTDPLTGLGNRLHLLEDLEQSTEPCLALVDIEDFSAINQSFGTEVGDSVLRQMASTILDFSEEHRTKAYRVYADTFAILGSSAAGEDFPNCVGTLLERLGVSQVVFKDQPASLITRIGFAARGKESFVCADIALKRAKQNRERLHVFDPGKEVGGTDLVENLKILSNVREALDKNRVFPVFQPIACAATREIVKYECLMRIADETGAVMMPDSFIEISKKTDLYKKLTLRMIEASLSAFQGNKFQFSMNLTIEDLLDSNTMTYLVTEARQKGVLGRLFVEIVETEELRDFERAGEVLDSLRAEGIGIAVDDFGSGYSNFEYLLRLNPEYIKIDRVIIQNILSDDRAKDLLRSIILFAKKTGIKTIAEFIDSEALMEEIRILGVDFAQGWLIGKAGSSLAG